MTAVNGGFHQTVVVLRLRADFLHGFQVRQAETKGLEAGRGRRGGLFDMRVLHQDKHGGVGILGKTEPDPAVSLGVPLVLDGSHAQVFAVKADGVIGVLNFKENMMPFGKIGNEF